MRISKLIFTCCLCWFVFTAHLAIGQATADAFEENLGQVWDEHGRPSNTVKFHRFANGLHVFLLPTGLAYQFERSEIPSDLELDLYRSDAMGLMAQAGDLRVRRETYRVDLELVGANPQAERIAEAPTRTRDHYYNRGVVGVRRFEQITYRDIYPNIDWVVRTEGDALKYDFVVRPGGDPAQIRMRFQHQTGLSLLPDGGLRVETMMGSLEDLPPTSLQGGRQVPTAFVLTGDEVRFAVGDYRHDEPLVIDPLVDWGTYYGGNSATYGIGCATDAAGNVFFCGYTASTVSIAAGGHQMAIGGGADGFITKFDSAGARLWSTYYGGSGNDYLIACATDSTGAILSTGFTYSDSNIAFNGHQDTLGGNVDGLVIKLDGNGLREWGTYYGDFYGESLFGCATDAAGNFYVTGYTTSPSGLGYQGHQLLNGGFVDACLAKYDGSGQMRWSTYYGGAEEDDGFRCAVGPDGSVFLAGHSNSTDAIAYQGFQNSLASPGLMDAFLAKFDSNGTRIWATYYGGEAEDLGFGCAVDSAGNAYLGGWTTSSTGIASNGHQNSHAGTDMDAYLIKFTPNGSLMWGSYLGGTGWESFHSLQVGDGQAVYAYGISDSPGFAHCGHDDSLGGNIVDAFLARFEPGGALSWSSYFGGEDGDIGQGCALDGRGHIFITGYTESTTGIGYNGFQNILLGNDDNAFLARLPLDIVRRGSRSDSACHSLVVNGQTYTASGQYTQWLSTASGCDSLLTLTVTIQAQPVTITVSGGTLTAAPAGAAYQWLDCGTGNAITGATAQLFSPTISGGYAVIVRQGACVDTTACEQVVAAAAPLNQLGVAIGPNPFTDRLHIVLPNPPQDMELRLMDAQGRIVHAQALVARVSEAALPPLASGIYVLQMTSRNLSGTVRLVRE